MPPAPACVSDRAPAAAARAGQRAGTRISVSTPHSTMLWPISSPSCSRLGKSTNTAVEGRRGRPHAEQHAVRRPLSPSIAASARRPVQRVRVSDIEQDDAVHAEAEEHRGRSGRRRGQRRAGEPEPAEHHQQRDADGSDPTATSHTLRKTRNSSGRISASEPTVFEMLSRRTTDSVSSAMRCPPANCTPSGGGGPRRGPPLASPAPAR